MITKLYPPPHICVNALNAKIHKLKMKIIDKILYENYIIKIINNIDIYSIQEQNKESTKIFFDTGSLHKIYIDEKYIDS